MNPFPYISPELLKVLLETFPLQAPQLSQTEKDLWWSGGQQHIMSFLKDRFKDQEEGHDPEKSTADGIQPVKMKVRGQIINV